MGAPVLRQLSCHQGNVVVRSSKQQGAITVQVYMVERTLKHISMDELSGAQAAAVDKAEELTSSGIPVRYIRSTFVPGDGRCMCLFEADSAEAVKKLNDEAQIPYDRVTTAFDLTPAS
jgi:muconolactone delta-isomerase